MQSILGGVGMGTQTRDGNKYQVNVHTQNCWCKQFQKTKIPSEHEITVMHQIKETHNDYLPGCIKKGVWAAASQDY
jgi:hypothetical protein